MGRGGEGRRKSVLTRNLFLGEISPNLKKLNLKIQWFKRVSFCYMVENLNIYAIIKPLSSRALTATGQTMVGVLWGPSQYSGTSDKGLSEIGTTSLQGTNRWSHSVHCLEVPLYIADNEGSAVGPVTKD